MRCLISKTQQLVKAKARRARISYLTQLHDHLDQRRLSRHAAAYLESSSNTNPFATQTFLSMAEGLH